VPRPPTADDLARFKVASEPRLSPGGGLVAFVVQTVAPRKDGYRSAIWLVDADGGSARQLTLGIHQDRHPRFSPDGRTLAFLSDRRTAVEDEPERAARVEREDQVQVHLLPLDGGEARRLTDLPRGVSDFEWSPDGRRLVAVSSSHGATLEQDDRLRAKRRRSPSQPPTSDFRFIDRLEYMLNGVGFTYDRVPHLWLVDAATGEAERLTDGAGPDREPAWSPDGDRIAFVSNRRADLDLRERSDLFVLDLASRTTTQVTAGPLSTFFAPTWLADGTTIAALGHRFAGRAGSRNDIWLFAADGRDGTPDGGTNLSGRHDRMPGSGMNSDIAPGHGPVLIPSADSRWIHFTAPDRGAYELWRIGVADGRLERLTTGRHYISAFHAVPTGRVAGSAVRIAYLRATPTEPSEVWLLDTDRRGPTADPVPLTDLNAEALADIERREPVERWVSVDGRDIQGWLIPAGPGRRPLVTEIHGGPHTLYGWSPIWEFQLLAATGMSVFYCNPRGSEGYGQDFNDANHRDWGPGPMRDVLAGVDALDADGLADPDHLGVTGGSYGGYLTNWIIGHDQRFRAAMTCRSVSDMTMLFTTGDISSGDWPGFEFEGTPWSDPEYFREISPITYADRIRTPLLIQHSERDIRCTIAQAEALFTVLRVHRRPVRFLRVPDENHELTRSGVPFRRMENLRVVVDWFRHFLIEDKRRLPPLPRLRGGR
jgi:dipeptidyl aminopeptidase/acylaminoacyl peptidase